MFWKLNKWGELYFFSLFTLHPVYSVRIQTKKWPFTGEFSKFFTFASIAFAKKPYCKFDFFEKNMTCLVKFLRVVSLCYKHITAVIYVTRCTDKCPYLREKKLPLNVSVKYKGTIGNFIDLRMNVREQIHFAASTDF